MLADRFCTRRIGLTPSKVTTCDASLWDIKDTPVLVETGEVLLNDLLSPREAVASAHEEIMACRMSDRTVAKRSEISKMERIDFRHRGWNHYFIERSAVMPAKINVVCALRALSFLPIIGSCSSAHSELLRGGQS